MRQRIALIIVVFVLCALPAAGQQSTRQDFIDFAKAMSGRWVGAITWVTDWPGIGKRGDKATGYSEIKLTEDGNALIGRFFGGIGSQTWLTVYDAANKQIRENGVDTGGTIWTCIYSKSGTQWSGTQTGCLANGSRMESKLLLTIADNGNTHTWTGTNVIGGKKVDDTHDVFHRLSK